MHDGHVLMDPNSARSGEHQTAMAMVSGYGRGVIELFRDRAHRRLSEGLSADATVQGVHSSPGVDCDVGAQILVDCGVKNTILHHKHIQTSGVQ